MTYLQELTNTRQKQPNTMVAGITSQILQIRKESIKQSLSDINTIGHRQEYIATIDGVMYYDDSRAENVNATWFTFENIVRPVIWIAGGDDLNIDFKELRRITRNKVKALVCIGKAQANMVKSFQKEIDDIFKAESLEKAVMMASLLAKDDDIVLFSPACKSASANYEERGEQFIETVKKLRK
ncbi:MAG: hypothetical protein IJ057_11295 [Bacteroidales bacterium]|nr:hypothetical protein [Bacteroidales bacterium]